MNPFTLLFSLFVFFSTLLIGMCVHLPVLTCMQQYTYELDLCTLKLCHCQSKFGADTMESGRVFVVCTGFISPAFSLTFRIRVCVCVLIGAIVSLKQRSFVYCQCARSEKRQICITFNWISLVFSALFPPWFQFPYCHCSATLFSHFITHTLWRLNKIVHRFGSCQFRPFLPLCICHLSRSSSFRSIWILISRWCWRHGGGVFQFVHL